MAKQRTRAIVWCGAQQRHDRWYVACYHSPFNKSAHLCSFRPRWFKDHARAVAIAAAHNATHPEMVLV